MVYSQVGGPIMSHVRPLQHAIPAQPSPASAQSPAHCPDVLHLPSQHCALAEHVVGDWFGMQTHAASSAQIPASHGAPVIEHPVVAPSDVSDATSGAPSAAPSASASASTGDESSIAEGAASDSGESSGLLDTICPTTEKPARAEQAKQKDEPAATHAYEAITRHARADAARPRDVSPFGRDGDPRENQNVAKRASVVAIDGHPACAISSPRIRTAGFDSAKRARPSSTRRRSPKGGGPHPLPVRRNAHASSLFATYAATRARARASDSHRRPRRAWARASEPRRALADELRKNEDDLARGEPDLVAVAKPRRSVDLVRPSTMRNDTHRRR